ncbi:MAG: hypothetical protein SPL15_04630 [Lachnospiraceae bacterium]|nr:hypothetical protein [Lachnospiraceae bacterium]MDY5742263.1 hypothetical protein [Lachnospiraceae bacterium]
MPKDLRERDFRYSDILYRPHHRSGSRPHMGMRERAAMFAPFAALTGYEEAVRETERYTADRRELTEEEEQRLNGQ